MGPKDKAPKAFIERARDCVEAGDVPAAVAELERGLALHAQSPKLLFELGYLLYEAGEGARSQELLRQAVTFAPEQNCRVFFTLSEVSSPDEAWDWAQRGVAAGGTQLQRMQEQMDALDATADARRAALVAKAAVLRRVVAQGCCKLAELAEVCGKPPRDALSALAESNRLDAAYLEPYAHLLLFHFNAQSEALFDQTLAQLMGRVRELEANDDSDLEGYDAEFFNRVSRLLLETERLPEAVEWSETAAELHPRDLMALYLHAFACWRAGKSADAAAALEELEELDVLGSGDEELIAGFSELREALASGADMETRMAP